MSTKRVQDIIIGKDVTSGEGFVRVLNDQMAALSAGDTIADSPIIYIEQVLAGGTNKILSLPIHGTNVTKWSGRSAVNAVNQVTTIGTPNVISDQEYGVYINIISDKEMSLGNRRFYCQFVSDTTATAAEIATGMAAAINTAPTSAYVTAAVVSTTTITVTGNNPSIYFTVGKAIGYDSGVTVTTGTNWDPGIGTYDQVLALEEIAKGYKGYMGERRTFVGNLPGFARPTYFSTGTPLSTTSVYDMYTVDHEEPFDFQTGTSNRKSVSLNICTIKAPSTWLQANFEAIINPWMASTPGAFAAVNI